MTSKLKVNLINDSGDNNIITSDGAGSFTASSSLASSVQSVGGIQMTPAFYAYAGGATTVSNSTWVKVSIGTELFDTNSNYDTSTSRFTPSIAGKYFFTATIFANANSVGELREVYLALYKNGTNHTMLSEENLNNAFDEYRRTATGTAIDTANGTSDYYEIYAHINNTSGSPAYSGSGVKGIKFGAYRIIGA
jgi:hypothetical protein